MELANCRKCKKVYTKIRSVICPCCEKEEEGLFLSVQDYLRENPKSPLSEVAEATGVTAKKILGYIRDGRLEVAKAEGLHCRNCGEPISAGHFCTGCQDRVAKEAESLLASMRPTATTKESLSSNGAKITMHTHKR
ncbi:MAG: hypothetical protein FWE21_06015 [Defluviitaleaceae bacterium]|nr:hypothetical protein [Defluviitaleaceae bacterium]